MSPVSRDQEESRLPRLEPKALSLEPEDREHLQQVLNRHQTPPQMALRAQIILLADAGHNHRAIARQWKISHQMARLWRNRWFEGQAKGLAVSARLQDAERSGAPAKFALEQLLHLFQLACEAPSA